MTADVIALTERMPDTWTMVAGLMAGGPGAGVTTSGHGAVIQLNDAEGRPLVSVESPLLVQPPAEPERLLGVKVAGPVWWTEVRAATGVPGGERLASVIATRLVARLGGVVWPSSATASDGGAAPVTGLTATAPRAAAQPAVDVLTDQVAAVILDRPVVAMTTWLSDALRAATASGRGLHVVTPDTARLSIPARTALSGLPNRWVVRDGDGGYFDGLSGSELRWRDGAFAATGAPAPGFVDATAGAAGGEGRQLMLTFATRHPPERELLLGGALEAAWRRLTGGAGPVGWGTAEPAGVPWSREELTALARRRAPKATWLVVVGDGNGDGDGTAIATLRVSRTGGGVEEDVTLVAGIAGDEAPSGSEAELRALATELAEEHGLVSLLAQRRRARADLTVPAHLEGAPAPLAFALGGAGVADVGGAERARRAPVSRPPVALGGAAGLYYPLAAGGWDAFAELMGFLSARGRG